MKKLLTMMTAVALGTCAWADGVALLAEDFSRWTNDTDKAYLTVLQGTNEWSYLRAGVAATIGESELAVTDGKLALNTGSKTLTAKFASSPLTIPQNTGYYFSSKVTFKDPSDTLPTLGEQDKFALVVLDNVESAAEGQNTTNLWVIAKYGPDNEVKRAFQLKIPISGAKPEWDDNGGEIIENIDAGWLAAEHEIVVKFYNNVMKSGNTARAGFMVMIDGYICAVVKACEINSENVINLSNAVYADGDNEYLGFAATAIDDSVGQRYAKDQLLLSIIDLNASLSSVDFQGQGVIDDVALATSGFDFGPDATVVTFAGYNSAAIESITYGGQRVTDGAYTITGNENFGDTVDIVVTLKSGYALEDEGGVIHTSSYTLSKAPATASEIITLDVFKIEAYVGEVACRSFADALATVNANGGTLKLSKDVTVDYMDFSSADKLAILDLNGKKITGTSTECATIVNSGLLKIIDTGTNGKVLATAIGSVENNKTLTIVAGIYEGAVNTAVLGELVNDILETYGDASTTVEGGTFDGTFVVKASEFEGYTASASVSGGKFKNKPADTVLAEGFAFSDAVGGYYSVVDASTSDYPESDELVVYDENLSEEEKAEQKAAVEATFDAIADASSDIDDADTAVTTYIDTVYDGTVPAAALIGAKSVDISVAFNLPLMKTEEPIVEIVAEAVGANDAAAFSFQIEDGENNPVAIKAAVAKVYDMIRYATDLANLDNGKVAAGNADVECVVDVGNKKIKVNMKKTKNKGFMKVKLR